MDYKQLKDEIKEIVEIAASVPENFREKCFEVLLNHLLSGKHQKVPLVAAPEEKASPPGREQILALPPHVRAFMRRKGITQEQITAIIMLDEDGSVHFLKEPAHGQVTKGQNEWALLIALKNGILNNALKADPEEVRSIVQEKGFYDPANFAANFKKAKYAELFRAPLEPQGSSQPLSSDGESALADLIKVLAG